MHLRVGIQVRGSPGLVVNRPRGAGEYVLVHFLEPAKLGRDQPHPAAADTCVLFRPETSTYLVGDTVIYNNFVHLSPELVHEPLQQYPVPLDRPFAPRTSDFILPMLSRLQREWVQRDRHSQDAIRLTVADLLLSLSRSVDEHSSPAVSRHADRLRQIRLAVHRAPAEPWTVASMAELAHLKESQFSVLFKQLFGRPPMEDLIQVRLELAKYYLANYELSVSEVGRQSGFADLSYFSRRFHRHAGVPPSVYGRRSRSR